MIRIIKTIICFFIANPIGMVATNHANGTHKKQDNLSWNEDPITNFKHNSDYNHFQYILEWSKDSNNVARLSDLGTSVSGNETNIGGNFKNDFTLRFNSMPLMFIGNNDDATNVNEIKTFKKGEQSIADQSDDIYNEKTLLLKYFDDVNQNPTSNNWNNGRKKDSPNVFEDFYWYTNEIANQLQNWQKYWMNYLTNTKQEGSEKIFHNTFSLFNKKLSEMFQNKTNGKITNNFLGYFNLNNAENDFKYNKFISSLARDPLILPIVNANSYRCGLNYGIAIHFIELIENIKIKTINYSLDDVLSINNNGVTMYQNKPHYFYTIGLNNDYFLAAEGTYRNNNTYNDYVLNIKDELYKDKWIPYSSIKNQINYEQLRDEALNYIGTKIIANDDLLKEKKYDPINKLISYNNINNIQNSIYEWTCNNKMVPSQQIINEIISDNKNDKWYQSAKQYNIYSKNIYIYLLLVLPELKYSTNLYLSNSQNNPTAFNKVNNLNEKIDGADGFFTFEELIDGHQVIIDMYDNNINFKTNIEIKSEIQNNKNNIKITNFKNDKNIINYEDKNNIKLFEEQKDSYYKIQKEEVNVINLLEQDKVILNDKYKEMTPSEALNSIYSDTYYNKLKEMYISKQDNAICAPFYLVDIYNNIIENIPNEYINLTINDYAGSIIIELKDTNQNIIDTITCSNFKTTNDIKIETNFTNIDLGIIQPNVITNKTYLITSSNVPTNTNIQVIIENNNIASYYEVYNYNSSNSKQLEINIKPNNVGQTKMKINIYDSDNRKLIYKSETHIISVEYIYNPKEQSPKIINANWDKNIILDKNIVYSFEIENYIEDTIVKIKKPNNIEIEFINELNTQFRIWSNDNKTINETITIQLVDKNYNEIIYQELNVEVSIDQKNNSVPISAILLIFGSITLVGVVLLVFIYYKKKTKNHLQETQK